MASLIGNIKNYFFPTETTKGNMQVKGSVSKDLRYAQIAPIIFARRTQDIQSWRDAITEAEAGMVQFKQRVKQQQIYIDVILNGHVTAVMNRRKSLTMRKGFELYNPDGSVNEEATKLINKDWFYRVLDARLDAEFFGYSLLNFSDVYNNELFSRDAFGNLAPIKVIPRPWVSPDRLNVVNIPYNVVGVPFRDLKYRDADGNCPYDWTFYFGTKTQIGISECGYGLLYKIAMYEIYLRHLAGQEATFMELYGSPMRVGKTSKTGDERDQFFADLYNMGNSATIVLDHADEVELIDSRNIGTGYQAFENFQMRLEKAITKIVLGHEDAMSSTAGKLGSNEEAIKALKEKESEDCRSIAHDIDVEVLPKLRKLGLPIPDGVKFRFNNIEEEEEYRKKVDESNKATADVFKTIADAGGKPDWKYFTERTGIPVEEASQNDPQLSQNVLTRLKNMYDELQ